VTLLFEDDFDAPVLLAALRIVRAAAQYLLQNTSGMSKMKVMLI